MWCPVTQDVFLLIDDLERVAGIEPANSRWQRDRLPLHHTRIKTCLQYSISFIASLTSLYNFIDTAL